MVVLSGLRRRIRPPAVLTSHPGRTRVRSHIQSVLIVTKARDNRLIKLTRELALYLMMKRRNGERGMTV